MTRKTLLVLCLVMFGVPLASAGVVKSTTKVVKTAVKAGSHPVRHPIKDGKAVGHAIRKVVW